MDRKRNRGEDARFIEDWKRQHADHIFLRFDVFIIRELGYPFRTKRELERQRRSAFLDFRRKTKHFSFASLPTMRKWFGMGGFSWPRREQVLAICLKLQTGREKAQEYLTVGLGETAFQIRDHREVIFMYGLENEIAYEDCLELIEQFESQWNFQSLQGERMSDAAFEQAFLKIKREPAEIFIAWMLSEEKFFTGYQDVVLDALQECRKEILFFIRRDASEKLENLLAETNYKKWLSGKKYHDLEPREILRRFVKTYQKANYKEVSQNMRDNILELSSIAYSPLEANSKLLAEVFPYAGNTFFSQIKGMSAKHLSDLFNVSLQWERLLVSNQTCRKLRSLDAGSRCPGWVKDIVETYDKHIPELKTVEDALSELVKYTKEQRRRCIDIRRSDLLPMIHYVSQCRYLAHIEKEGEKYDGKRAKDFFVIQANHMLEICRMAPLNEEYELDAVLLSCFWPEEMYFFPEILELAKI